MSGYRLRRADVTGETQPIWLLSFPGCGERPVVIPGGNMAELVGQYMEQGGTIPTDGDADDADRGH